MLEEVSEETEVVFPQVESLCMFRELPKTVDLEGDLKVTAWKSMMRSGGGG